MAAGHPAFKGPQGCGGTLVRNRTPKSGCRQGEDNPQSFPRLIDSLDVLRSRGLGTPPQAPDHRGRDTCSREREQRQPWHPRELTAAVQLVSRARSPGRCSLPIEIGASVQKSACGVCLNLVAYAYPEVCLLFANFTLSQ